MIKPELPMLKLLRPHLALLLVTAWTVALGLSQRAQGQTDSPISFEVEDDQVTVLLDGQLLTRYHTEGGQVPFFWPVIGPDGAEMTRSFPMRAGTQGEAVDHPHQRSFWFAHGDVNGIDFWHVANKSGRIEHQRFLKVGDSSEPVLITENHWLDDDGEKQCSDIRVLRFGTGENDQRWIDFDISILADADAPVEFGDTKEGCLGLRVASTIKVDAESGGGHIINNNSDRDDETWGKTGAWVDYHGPVNDQIVGIAILNHPDSFRFPTYWHVRSYGLFAANAFGWRAFRNAPGEDGSYTLAPGESMTFCYRVLLHRGDETEGNVRDAFIAYAKEDKSQTPAALFEQLLTDPPAASEDDIEIQPQAKTARVPETRG